MAGAMRTLSLRLHIDTHAGIPHCAAFLPKTENITQGILESCEAAIYKLLQSESEKIMITHRHYLEDKHIDRHIADGSMPRRLFCISITA